MSGKWQRVDLRKRLIRATGLRGREIARILKPLLKTFPDMPPKTIESVISCLHETDIPVHIAEYFWNLPAMEEPRRWDVLAITTKDQLAKWLGISTSRLEWFADILGTTPRATEERMRHYRQRWIPKRRGRWRLLEIPKARLKVIQRQILKEIVNKIPPHNLAHAFRNGRSIVSFAEPHVSQTIVLRFDLQDYFVSIPHSQIVSVFKSAGYPLTIARLLACLCTTSTNDETLAKLLEEPASCARYQSRHLPQGAPTSPSLANLRSFELDVRLAALASHFDATYTRYADDMAFSGGTSLARSSRRFQVLVGVIVAESGFELNFRKNRFMRQGIRQQLVGIVVNQHPNIKRNEFDRIKAVLHNCLTKGVVTQNRDQRADFRAVLRGQIAYVEQVNPQRGEKLRRVFDAIQWPEEDF
ncbi:MAG: reverse transcriptase family protein [Gemmataceae bacterium]